MKKTLLCFGIAVLVTGLQIAAWLMNKDGMMFALTTSTITGALGFAIGTTIKTKKEVE